MPRQESAWQTLGDRSSLNWRTHLLFAIPAISVGMTFDLPRLGGEPAGWFVLTMLALIVTVLSIEGLSQLFGKSGWTKSRPLTVVLILLTAGFFRGLTFMLGGGALELVPESDIGFRLIGGPVFTVTVYLLMNTLVQAHLAQRELALELTMERENLEFSKRSFETELVRLRDAQMQRVRESVIPAVWELRKLLKDASLSKNASKAISALRELNDNVVRPLSHNLTRNFELPTLSKSQTQLSQLGQFVLPSHISFDRIIQLGTLVPFVMIMSYSTTSALSGPVAALLVSTSALLLISLQLFVWRKLLGPRKFPLVWGLFISVLIGVLLGLSVSALLLVPVFELPQRIVAQAVGFFVVTMTVMFGLAVTSLQRDASIAEMEQVVEELRLLNTKLRQRVWLSQKTLATELHGSVQAALNASAMRLATLASPTEADLDRVRVDIESALAKLGREDYLEGENFEDLLEQIAELWDSTCHVNYTMTKSVAAVLSDSSATAYCTLEVIREAINNAIKHGQATRVDIEIDAHSDLIDLKVSNNGNMNQRNSYGLGSRLYQELTVSHELRINKEVALLARIPIGPSAQEPQLL